MKITDIKIRKLFKTGKMKGVFSVTFDNQLVVHDIKLIESNGGCFLAMPSRRLDNGDYIDMVHPINKEFRNVLEKEILEIYLNTKLKNGKKQ